MAYFNFWHPPHTLSEPWGGQAEEQRERRERAEVSTVITNLSDNYTHSCPFCSWQSWFSSITLEQNRKTIITKIQISGRGQWGAGGGGSGDGEEGDICNTSPITQASLPSVQVVPVAPQVLAFLEIQWHLVILGGLFRPAEEEGVNIGSYHYETQCR